MNYVRSNIGSGSISTSNSVVLPYRIDRKYLLLRNMHASNTLFLAFDKAAELNKGIPVKAGEAYEMTGDNLCLGSINAIANAASTTISYLEGF